jgi:hypothetical protein
MWNHVLRRTRAKAAKAALRKGDKPMTNHLISTLKAIALVTVFAAVSCAGPGSSVPYLTVKVLDGPGGSGYPHLTAAPLDGPGGSAGYSHLTVAVLDGPGLGGGYIR